MQKSDKRRILYTAKKHCCNWFHGNCIGGVFYIRDNSLHMLMDEKLAGKSCVAHKKCRFFQEVVIPGIKDEYYNI